MSMNYKYINYNASYKMTWIFKGKVPVLYFIQKLNQIAYLITANFFRHLLTVLP